MSKKVRTTDGKWVRDQPPLDVPSLHECVSGAEGAESSVEAQAEALIAALDDADDASGAHGARVIDIGDFDEFATAELNQQADDIIALMMRYETNAAGGAGSNGGGSNAGSGSNAEITSDEVSAVLADAGLERIGQGSGGEGDEELKDLMKKLSVDLKAHKNGIREKE